MNKQDALERAKEAAAGEFILKNHPTRKDIKAFKLGYDAGLSARPQVSREAMIERATEWYYANARHQDIDHYEQLADFAIAQMSVGGEGDENGK